MCTLEFVLRSPLHFLISNRPVTLLPERSLLEAVLYLRAHAGWGHAPRREVSSSTCCSASAMSANNLSCAPAVMFYANYSTSRHVKSTSNVESGAVKY